MAFPCIEKAGCFISGADASLDEGRCSGAPDPEFAVEGEDLVEAERYGPEERGIAYEPDSGSIDSKSPCFSPIR